MTASRLRLLAFLAVAFLAASLFLAWSQSWFTLRLDTGELVVGGDVAGSALPALALASLALIAALALAGPFFRVVLGVLEALLGLAVVLSVAAALGDPAGISASAVTELTGVSGGDSVGALVTSAEATAWPFVAIGVGALTILVGVGIALTARSWPASGRRYSRTRLEDAAGDPVAEWDALSDGDDPTDRP